MQYTTEYACPLSTHTKQCILYERWCMQVSFLTRDYLFITKCIANICAKYIALYCFTFSWHWSSVVLTVVSPQGVLLALSMSCYSPQCEATRVFIHYRWVSTLRDSLDRGHAVKECEG